MTDFNMKRENVQNELNKKLNKIEQDGINKSNKVKSKAFDKLEKINRQENKAMMQNIIPIFFASDSNYLPYLSVSLLSLMKNANKNYTYNIYILHSNISEIEQKPILKLSDKTFNISFVNVSERLQEVNSKLQLRDYYTGATYYRIFIANMFPSIDKALYLDSDTIVLKDISRLYNYDLMDNYIGAVTDKVVSSHEVFQKYCNEVLGIAPNRYINAGILLMNLKKFREDNFYKKFCDLLVEYKFSVAQDQDYLNVLCKDKIRYLPYRWNTMPIGGESKTLPSLIHYNLTMKPWHYMDIPYAKHFWEYAKESSYSDLIRKTFGEHTNEKKEKDGQTEKGLIELAIKEINREDNFIKARRQKRDFFESLFDVENNGEIIGVKN